MKFVVLVFWTGLFMISAEVFSEKEDEAKEHFFKGKALVEEGAYEQAVVELKESYNLNPVPIVLYNIAYCFDELKQYGEAVKHYRLFLSKGKKAPKEMRKRASKRIEELSQFLGTLKLEVDVEGAEVFIDNSPAGLTPVSEILIEAGKHYLMVRKEGYSTIYEEVTVLSGDTLELSFKIAEPEAQPLKEKKTKGKRKKRKALGPAPFAAMLSFTVAALAASVLTGTFALIKDGEVRKSTAGTPEAEELKDLRKRLAHSCNVLIGVTAVAAGTTIALGIVTDFKSGKGKMEKHTGFYLFPDLQAGSILFGYSGTF